MRKTYSHKRFFNKNKILIAGRRKKQVNDKMFYDLERGDQPSVDWFYACVWDSRRGEQRFTFLCAPPPVWILLNGKLIAWNVINTIIM